MANVESSKENEAKNINGTLTEDCINHLFLGGQEEGSSSIEDPFEADIKLMEGLFEKDQKRAQRLLAVLDNHNSPVNCVRWNNIGTLFLSAADDGSTILWEYKGEKVVTAFERQ